MRTVTFAAGLAAGYILGTRAGREKYQQIVAGARNFAGQPAVVSAQEKLKGIVGAGTDAVTEKIGSNRTGGATGSSTTSSSTTGSSTIGTDPNVNGSSSTMPMTDSTNRR